MNHRRLYALLPPWRRMLIEVAAQHGVTTAQIAQRLGWPVETVNREIRLGLRSLRSDPLA